MAKQHYFTYLEEDDRLLLECEDCGLVISFYDPRHESECIPKEDYEEDG